jgi:CMP/dCMP kinase
MSSVPAPGRPGAEGSPESVVPTDLPAHAGLQVALDGPGSSGKSSVGAAAARALGYRFLDTGVLYRALAWCSVRRGTDPEDEVTLAALVPSLDLAPDAEGSLRRVLVDGRDVTGELHAPEVDRRVSTVARQSRVREALLKPQRDLAAAGSIIVAGRDIGTVVLPDAEIKLYLEVSLEERARRRTAERELAADSPEAMTILADLRRRDHIDSSREVAPLRIPEDAIIVRSDGRSFEDTVAEVVTIVHAREAGATQDQWRQTR